MSGFLYLFNYDGDWIAFKLVNYLFNKNSDWIGWFPWNSDIAMSTDGEYLGSIYCNDRLLYNEQQIYMGNVGYPANPASPANPCYPAQRGCLCNISGVVDVPKKFLKTDK